MGVANDLKSGLSPLVDLLYPPRCPLCGDALAAQGGLCAECWPMLEAPAAPLCSRCARPVAETKASEPICWQCREDPPKHAGVIAACVYNDASRDLLLSFKHGGKITLARLLARLMASRIPEGREPLPLLIPVPLHRFRLWERGYNQAGLLARELARLGKGELCVDGLIRPKRTPSLGGLGKEARRKALEGAIAVRASRKAGLVDRDILLVDDVYTSGATSAACTQALVECGARSVTIVCFARVIDA